MPRKLRVVEPGEGAEKRRWSRQRLPRRLLVILVLLPMPRKLSVTQAADANDHRELLVALRSRIAAAVQSPSTSAVALAALSRQLTLISRELERIDAPEVDPIANASRIPDDAWDGAV